MEGMNMARLASEGNVKVYKVPTVSSKAAPTTSEITAGTDLTPQLPTSGVEITWTQNNASLPMLDESFVASVVGTEQAEITLTGVRDDTSDDFWDAFERGENFYLVVSRFGDAGSGSAVEVYPCQSHRPVPLTPAENEFQQAQVTLAVYDTPVLDATVGS
jgi:hypothetical protein